MNVNLIYPMMFAKMAESTSTIVEKICKKIFLIRLRTPFILLLRLDGFWSLQTILSNIFTPK